MGSGSFWPTIRVEVKALASLPGSVASRRLCGTKSRDSIKYYLVQETDWGVSGGFSVLSEAIA